MDIAQLWDPIQPRGQVIQSQCLNEKLECSGAHKASTNPRKQCQPTLGGRTTQRQHRWQQKLQQQQQRQKEQLQQPPKNQKR